MIPSPISAVKKRLPNKKKPSLTPIQKIVNHYFLSKNITLEKLKEDARKKKIIYARFAKAAKDLLDLAGSVSKAKGGITKVAKWATSRGLDYSIETVTKKWLELSRLKPKKIERKAFYDGRPMRQKDGRWYVVSDDGEWLEYNDAESKIEWR